MRGLILVLFLVLSNTFVKSQVYDLKWQPQPYQIDGDKSDWNDRPRYYDGETGILYEVRNDSVNLYLVFEIPNQQTQMKAMNAGFQVNIKVKSKPKVKAQISFPIINNQEVAVMPEKSMFENAKNNYLLLNDYAQIDGFVVSSGNISKNKSKSKFIYATGWDNKNTMLYEIQIPFSELFVEKTTLKAISKTDIKFDVKVLAMKRPAGSGMPNQSSMNSGGGKGQGRGGGKSGGGRGQHSGGMNSQGNSSQMSAKFNEQTFNFTVRTTLNK